MNFITSFFSIILEPPAEFQSTRILKLLQSNWKIIPGGKKWKLGYFDYLERRLFENFHSSNRNFARIIFQHEKNLCKVIKIRDDEITTKKKYTNTSFWKFL